jgi:hypothetical protein
MLWLLKIASKASIGKMIPWGIVSSKEYEVRKKRRGLELESKQI